MKLRMVVRVTVRPTTDEDCDDERGRSQGETDDDDDDDDDAAAAAAAAADDAATARSRGKYAATEALRK